MTAQLLSAWEPVFERIRAEGIRRVRIAWADQHGVSRAKVVPTALFPKLVGEGLRSNVGTLLGDSAGKIIINPFSSGGGFGRAEMTGAPDLVIRPDPQTFRVLPWAAQTGWVTGDMFFTTGEPLPYSSRGQLRGAIDAATATGVSAIVGVELEFHLTRNVAQARTIGLPGEPGTAGSVVPTNSGYQHQSEADLDEVSEFLDVLQDNLEALNFPVRTIESELGPSQFELSLDVLPALEGGDASFLLKNAAKMIAKRHGYHITFMARPGIPGFFSSGWHLHMSMVDQTGRNLFVPDDDKLLSRYGRHFTNGVLIHAREGALLSNSTVTGYKRLRPNSLAPDRLCWGADNRGAMVRVTGERADGSTHIENRIGDTAANGYLYIAGQILAGLDGVARGEEPPSPTEVPYETEATRLPTSLAEAVREFENSEFFRKAMGEEFVRFYAAHKRSEAERFERSDLGRTDEPDAVSEWEQREYFDLY
ncbi:glutamine synthetase family protein [Pseudonocardia sp. GCM10023141]|uniref:glutamine synthetase family protein n=1 Tax=Pseudonocardia sp. GCM10023141 TaxID=3252653 RepID=UPI00361F0212